MILKKITKMVATRGQILWLKCIKFDFGSAPDPAGGVYSVPQTSARFKGPTSKSGGRKGRKDRDGRKRTGKGEGEKKGGGADRRE